jgi:hypothetical protein
MQGPSFDILLLLLILFFGLEQRSRPQIYVRFWFAGWLLVREKRCLAGDRGAYALHKARSEGRRCSYLG